MRVVFLSDLHLGSGRVAPIFAGAAELPALLDGLDGPDVHVIVNGDAFDFLLNDDPLNLDEGRAVAEAEAMARQPASKAVLYALGRVLARGGEVTVRLGNHDVELALDAVQHMLRCSMGQPESVAERLCFERGEAPGLLEVGGVRVLYTHGEHSDAWNRIDYGDLEAGRFHYPPGSELVKGLINPLKARGLAFVDLLKPDIHGAVLAALAVDPAAVRAVDLGLVARLVGRVMRRKHDPLSFSWRSGSDVPESAISPTPDPLADRLDAAGLTDDEREAVAALLDGSAPTFRSHPEALSFGGADRGSEAEPAGGDLALGKVLRAGLLPYARFHRSVAGEAGRAFFELVPGKEEWAEAERLARSHKAQVVVQGHSHAARLRAEDRLVYANTGTWIGLMRLPDPDAPAADWAAFLERLRANPGLDPAKAGEPVLKRLTAVEIHEVPGGATVSLFAWESGGRQDLLTATVRAAG